MNASECVANWLSEQGYKSSRDSDGDVQFRYEGFHMFCTDDKRDPLFLRIIMPGIYTVDGDRAKVLEAINAISRDIKAIKAFLVEDKLWLAIEMYIDTTPDVDDFIERCLDIMVAGFNRIKQEILG